MLWLMTQCWKVEGGRGVVEGGGHACVCVCVCDREREIECK